MIESQHFVRLFQCSAKAMKDAAQLVRIWLHHLERVVPGVALMNHHIEPQLHRQIELLLKQTRLARFVGAIVNTRFDFFLGFALQRPREHLHFLLLGCFHARQMMIIKPRFAQRDDSRIFGEIA